MDNCLLASHFQLPVCSAARHFIIKASFQLFQYAVLILQKKIPKEMTEWLKETLTVLICSSTATQAFKFSRRNFWLLYPASLAVHNLWPLWTALSQFSQHFTSIHTRWESVQSSYGVRRRIGGHEFISQKYFEHHRLDRNAPHNEKPCWKFPLNISWLGRASLANLN